MLRRILPIAVLLVLSGCLVEHCSTSTHTGIRVSPEIFGQIKPGDTT